MRAISLSLLRIGFHLVPRELVCLDLQHFLDIASLLKPRRHIESGSCIGFGEAEHFFVHPLRAGSRHDVGGLCDHILRLAGPASTKRP